jgi:hypothetical protein
MQDDFKKTTPPLTGGVLANLEPLLYQRQEAQNLCGENLLTLAALLPFHQKFCPENLTPERFGNLPILLKLDQYQRTNRQGLELQIDVDDAYKLKITEFISTPGCLFYLPNAIYETYGLPLNGQLLEGQETPFYDWTFEETPFSLRRKQALVIQDINGTLPIINDVLVQDVQRHFPYNYTKKGYMSAFRFMLERHPTELINCDPCDWMEKVLKRICQDQHLPPTSVTAKILLQ